MVILVYGIYKWRVINDIGYDLWKCILCALWFRFSNIRLVGISWFGHDARKFYVVRKRWKIYISGNQEVSFEHISRYIRLCRESCKTAVGNTYSVYSRNDSLYIGFVIAQLIIYTYMELHKILTSIQAKQAFTLLPYFWLLFTRFGSPYRLHYHRLLS